MQRAGATETDKERVFTVSGVCNNRETIIIRFINNKYTNGDRQPLNRECMRLCVETNEKKLNVTNEIESGNASYAYKLWLWFKAINARK